MDRLRWMLVLGAPAAMVVAQAGIAQGTTTIADRVQFANGQAAQGTLLVSWPAFTTASGVAVQKGTTSVVLDANGDLNVQLAPNGGASPIGTFYTVVYHLSDGTVSQEYWNVPVSSGPVGLSAVRTQVLPTAVAQQTVSKAYVDAAIARAVATGVTPAATTAATGDGSPYVLKTGDTMTGALQLPGDPTSALQAADKNYVDSNVTAVQAGLDQKVSKVPAAAQTVTQPAGTELRTNRLNGVLYATPFVSQAGGDGLKNALAAPECATNCEVRIEPDYTGNESLTPESTGVFTYDERGGQIHETYASPVNPRDAGDDVAHTISLTATEVAANLAAQYGSGNLGSVGLRILQRGYRGGSNLFPQNITTTPPYFKSTYSATDTETLNYTLGQHVMDTHATRCYGVGDCLLGSHYMLSAGGFRDNADEGAHPFDLQIAETPDLFIGTCASGCTTGSQQVVVSISSGGSTQGDGRFLVDRAPSKVLSGYGLTGGNPTGYPAPTATFTGTSFPVSTMFTTAAVALPQANNMAPGVVTLPIQTSGVVAGFSTNTAVAPATTGVACVADAYTGNTGTPPNYEMAPYRVVDGTHLQLTLLKPHGNGATVAMGGLCGYGVEQTIDSGAGFRQIFPVIASPNATTLYVASGATSILGQNGTTSAYINAVYPLTSLVRNNNVVTVTTLNTQPQDVSGVGAAFTGAADASFNGVFTVTSTGPQTFTFAQAGPNAQTTGATMTVATTGYAISPIAEVLDVFNDATTTVDGTMKLAPNTVPWGVGDLLEEPHYFQQRVAADVEYVTQYMLRPSSQVQAGIYFSGNNGPGLRGWVINNTTPASSYLGAGGTNNAPDFAFQSLGVWNTAYDLQAGEQAAFRVHCNSKGCGRWDSAYNLFTLDTQVGYDSVRYAPQSSTMTFSMGGAQYSMNGQAMTVGTLNVTNLNATHINGSSSNGTTAQATSTAAGVVQLGPAATTAVLANVATSGSYADLANQPAIPTSNSQLANGAGYVTAAGAASAAPVQTVAGRTGAVTLTAADVSGLAASATVDTTNASNIKTGVLSAGLLPVGLGTCSTTVGYSAQPVFAVGCANATIHFAWAGNATGMTFSGLSAGAHVTLVFQAGGSGGWTVQWPAAVHGGFATSAAAGSAVYAQAGRYFVQELVVDADGATLLTPGR